VSSYFEIHETSFPAVKLIQRRRIDDSRGFFERLFCTTELSGLTESKPVVQINHTHTLRRGAVRGLHFQRQPYREHKFVTCIRGQVFDVAVDIRKSSATFLRWHSEILSDTNYKTLLIPEGFAHGFQTLSPDCELLYFHTAPYCATAEGAVNARDPLVNVRWPEEITEMSPRDLAHPMLAPPFAGLDS
jgi:dTDP-4-dehydrorhamnose 3,5-epimerase